MGRRRGDAHRGRRRCGARDRRRRAARNDGTSTPEAAVRARAARCSSRAIPTGSPSARAGGPAIILVVGVNGTGKTTTIGKLAARYKAQGRTVLLAAADTFRAAAIDQLRIWASAPACSRRARARRGPWGRRVRRARCRRRRGADLVIADTAGRLHTKSNLMDELTKIRRIIDKRLPGAEPETLFVLDATTGQNGLTQAKAFHEAVGLTGIVLTKLDSTPRAASSSRSSGRSMCRSGSSGWGSRSTTCCRSIPTRSSRRCSTDAPPRAGLPIAVITGRR